MAELVPVESFDIVIFGATGDLAQRKLLPALFHRWCDDQIPGDSRIIAASRDDMSSEDYRAFVEDKAAPKDADRRKRWDEFIQKVQYVAVDVDGDAPGWKDMAKSLDDTPGKVRLFYLALPPKIYGNVCRAIEKHDLRSDTTRIVLEKPIGHDFHSARDINRQVAEVFPEESIFRIDHYLGKETVQNLLILRFANFLFEPIWNANGIDHVQITAAESLGAGKRASYYDGAGAMRDMVQNHLLQLLCLVAMEAPSSLDADSVRTEKLKVLRALKPIREEDLDESIVRGQYKPGVIDGDKVEGYIDELGHDSETETFIAIRSEVENWRWAGVPFYLRTGKRMSERRSEIIVQFKDVPHDVVQADVGRPHPNRLIIRLQPDEGVKLMLMTKDPGPGGLRLRYVPLNLSYADTFEKDYPDAYERLLMAVVRGNLSLFMRGDEVEAAWRWVDQAIAAWTDGQSALHTYAAGTDGPTQSALLLEREGRHWFDGQTS